MLNAREPKIVNGPQILDKYVGESEANVRRLFADAEEEEKRVGNTPMLHGVCGKVMFHPSNVVQRMSPNPYLLDLQNVIYTFSSYSVST